MDNITFETDYPHTDSTWPDTKQVATELMAGVPSDVVEKIMRGNAHRVLFDHLDRLRHDQVERDHRATSSANPSRR